MGLKQNAFPVTVADNPVYFFLSVCMVGYSACINIKPLEVQE